MWVSYIIKSWRAFVCSVQMTASVSFVLCCRHTEVVSLFLSSECLFFLPLGIILKKQQKPLLLLHTANDYLAIANIKYTFSGWSSVLVAWMPFQSVLLSSVLQNQQLDLFLASSQMYSSVCECMCVLPVPVCLLCCARCHFVTLPLLARWKLIFPRGSGCDLDCFRLTAGRQAVQRLSAC